MKLADNDVSVKDVGSEMFYASLILEDEMRQMNMLGCVITAGSETSKKHVKNPTLHYAVYAPDGKLVRSGRALDYRIWYIARDVLLILCTRMRARLGRDYDVVLEKDHLHIEFQPVKEAV